MPIAVPCLFGHSFLICQPFFSSPPSTRLPCISGVTALKTPPLCRHHPAQPLPPTLVSFSEKKLRRTTSVWTARELTGTVWRAGRPPEFPISGLCQPLPLAVWPGISGSPDSSIANRPVSSIITTHPELARAPRLHRVAPAPPGHSTLRPCSAVPGRPPGSLCPHHTTGSRRPTGHLISHPKHTPTAPLECLDPMLSFCGALRPHR